MTKAQFKDAGSNDEGRDRCNITWRDVVAAWAVAAAVLFGIYAVGMTF